MRHSPFRLVAIAAIVILALIGSACGAAKGGDSTTTMPLEDVGLPEDATTLPADEGGGDSESDAPDAGEQGPQLEDLFFIGGQPVIFDAGSPGQVHQEGSPDVIEEVPASDLLIQAVRLDDDPDIYGFRVSPDGADLPGAVDLNYFDGVDSQRCGGFELGGGPAPGFFGSVPALPDEQAPLTFVVLMPPGLSNASFGFYTVDEAAGTYTAWFYPVILDGVDDAGVPFLDVPGVPDVFELAEDTEADCEFLAAFDSNDEVTFTFAPIP